MRQGEYFHDLKVPKENWTILRLDGRGFSKFTAEAFEKPFDERFHGHMVLTTKALVTEFNAVFAFTESDEISCLLPFEWDFFDREVEKVLSISAAVASSTFTLSFGQAVQFDSRIWISGKFESVLDYFRWRQGDAHRCALNGWTYWTLRQEGASASEATQRLSGLKSSDKQELLFQRGINFNDLPNWQKRGTGVCYESIEKEGFNPLTKETVTVERRALTVVEDLPFGDDLSEFLEARFRPQVEKI